MDKEISIIKNKIDSSGINFLDDNELEKYVRFRITNLLNQRYVLTEREVRYLLCETGPGNLRIDPLFCANLDLKFPLLSKGVSASTDSKIKMDIEKIVNTDGNNPYILEKFIAILKNNFDSLESVRFSETFTIKGNYNKTPVLIYISNKDWVLPNKQLIEFLRAAAEAQAQPIIISRKIHGILFPLFKVIGVLGVNTYRTYIPKESFKKIRGLEKKLALSSKYNDQLQEIEDYEKYFTDEYYKETNLRIFLDKVFPSAYQKYSSTFATLDFSEIDTFSRLVESIPKGKVKLALKNWVNSRDGY